MFNTTYKGNCKNTAQSDIRAWALSNLTPVDFSERIKPVTQ